MIEFVIPVDKDELLRPCSPQQYYVDQIITIQELPQAIDATRNALQSDGAKFIIQHFKTFFSVIVHGKKVELPIVMRAFSRLHKAIEMLVHHMEGIFDLGNEMMELEKQELLCINKMLAYLFSLFICHIDEDICKNSSEKCIEKRKKTTKTDLEEEWEINRQKSLEYVYRWLQLPLHKLWQPSLVEDAFISLITKMCYKILEQCKDAKQRHVRETVFEILGTSIKKYNQGISCAVRIIQLVKLHDMLATQLAIGVAYMVSQCGCNGLLREVMKEVDQTELGEADSRNISIFLEEIAIAKPDFIIPILGDIFEYLASDHYTMRNCTLGILGTVVKQALTGEDLTEKQKDLRDECLDNLVMHILDCNAYVRSKVLQIWQKLCSEDAIPLSRQKPLLSATILRLEDKSASVRKQALQLLRHLVQSNPFTGKLNKEELSKSLEKEDIKLRNMQTEFAKKSARGDDERLELWRRLLPEIRQVLQQVVNGSPKQHKKAVANLNEEVEFKSDEEFEYIRQLMLNGNILEAVQHLWYVCTKLENAPDMKNLSTEAKEECLFLLLLKIFMEFENVCNDTSESENSEKSDGIKKEEIAVQKRVVHYLRDCLEYATELEAIIPIARGLLFSTTASDAIEACKLLGTAYQFETAGAASAITDALYQVFHRDQSVRSNVASIYREIYLSDVGSQKSERQQAITCVKALIDLIRNLQPGQSPALTQLVVTWYNNKNLNSEVLQVLWEKFSMKSQDTTPIESRAALMLLTMIAQTESKIMTGNLEVLLKVGFGPRAKTDLLLARDTCKALLKIKHEIQDIEKPPIRYANDHDMFDEILILLAEHFASTEEDGYISFATEAINAIYHLANQPDRLMEQLLKDITVKGEFNSKPCSFFLLSKFIYLIGHIAIKQMVHLDTAVYKELKRRDLMRKMKRGSNLNKGETNSEKCKTPNFAATSSNSAGQMLRSKESATLVEDNGEDAVEGAADDADAEFINATLEGHIITGEGLLSKFVPLILDICKHPAKYNDENLQASGALALCKMMTVSAKFCEETLQLIVTILERSPYPGIKTNILIGISDLVSRFPNQVEPWMKHIYSRLRDENIKVRSTCVRVLSSLILRDMVRVRGQVSELALCIIDDDPEIRQDAIQFFRELSQKGNALYNVVPDILSRLTDVDVDLSEDNFQEILKNILCLLQKEKQMDAIIDKICARFKLATTERQWCSYAYCLSLLQFSAKSIRHLIESLPLLKDKIHNNHVQRALRTIIEHAKKKPSVKAFCMELEEKVNELVENTENTEIPISQAMPPPPVPKQKKSNRRARHKSSSEEDEDEDKDDDEDGNADEDTDSDAGPSNAYLSTSTTRKVQNRKKSVSSTGNVSSGPPIKRNRQVSMSGQTPQRTSTRLSQLRAKN